MDTKRKIISFFMTIIFIIFIMGFTDYWRSVHNFKKPIFSIYVKSEDDGGSGLYKGLGYTVKIKGNFMPDEELPGVTYAKFMILGNDVTEVIRD